MTGKYFSSLVAFSLGLVIWLLSVLLNQTTSLPLIREMSLFAGAAFILVALVQRFRATNWSGTDRFSLAGYTSIATLAAIMLVYGGIPEQWGSARLLFGGAAILGLGATVLIVVPTVPRKILLSLWVIFHFGGMFTSFASIDPPGSQGPFLAKHLWTFVYRPYLSFFYLTNAYHFYSPDPGPPNLLWFAVHYSDGSYMWIKIPTREKGQIGMHYQRVLALPEHSFSQNPRMPFTRSQVAGLRADQYDENNIWENIYDRRIRGSGVRYSARGQYIPLVTDIDVNVQFREPNDTSKKLLAAVANRVLKQAPKREGLSVRSVKIYRVTHQMLTPYELSRGISPFVKQKYWPYFMGEFNTEGEMVNPMDPFLYWYLPIVKVPATYPNHAPRDPQSGLPVFAVNLPAVEPNFELDCLEMHAAGPAKETNR